MQVAPKVPPLQRKVRRHQHLVPCRRPQDRAIVPDPQHYSRIASRTASRIVSRTASRIVSRIAAAASAKPNLLDQALLTQRLFLLFHREGSINGYPKVVEI